MSELKPAIRFEGNTNVWEQRKLGDIVEFFSGLTYSPDNVVEQPGTLVLRSSNVQNGEIVNADNVYVKDEVVNSDNVQVGDIAVVVRNGSKRLIGKHAAIKSPMKNTVIGAFMTGVRSDTPAFTNALLDSKQFEIEIEKNLGATINQITTGNFKKMTFNFPQVDERLKIGGFFNQLDNTIALHQRELKKITQFKQAMLRKMFPKEGETVPEVRFEGFEGEWEKSILGNVITTVNLNNYMSKPNNTGKYPVIQQGYVAVVGYTDSNMYMDSQRLVLFGDHTLSLYKPRTHFAVATDGVKGIYINGFTQNFTYQLIDKYKPKSEGYKRYLSILKNKEVYFPSNKKEAKVIGDFFDSLDQNIASKQKELTKFKQFKQAMLEKMFV